MEDKPAALLACGTSIVAHRTASVGSKAFATSSFEFMLCGYLINLVFRTFLIGSKGTLLTECTGSGQLVAGGIDDFMWAE